MFSLYLNLKIYNIINNYLTHLVFSVSTVSNGTSKLWPKDFALGSYIRAQKNWSIIYSTDIEFG